MEDKEKPKLRTDLIIGIPLLIFVLVCVAIALPGWVSFRGYGYCGDVEDDALNITTAMEAYFSAPEHHTITRGDIEKLATVPIDNPWTITKCGDNYYILVVDRSGKCPHEYQDRHPEWNSGIYTFRMKDD